MAETVDINAFAQSWIKDWNAHDLDAILAHYASELTFCSPKVAIYTKGAQTFFTSREALRPYFAYAIAMRPALRFDLRHVVQDKDGIGLVYNNELGHVAVELMSLDAQGQVSQARVLYSA